MTLRSRLTLVYATVFAVLLVVIGITSYKLLAYQLEQDATTNLLALTSGLHGYLRFQGGVPVVVFNADDPVATAFVREATRYYQVFDAVTGDLLPEHLVAQQAPENGKRLATYDPNGGGR